MKKIISFALVLAMLASMLVITVNAADPYGTIIKVPYTTEKPSMAEALPDASWGDLLIHVDKDSPNAAINDYGYNRIESQTGQRTSNMKVDQSVYLDVYAKWTDSTFYLCFVSGDSSPMGSGVPWIGDGIQLNMNLGSWWTSMYSADYGTYYNKSWYEYSYIVTTDYDDVSCQIDGKCWELEEEPVLYWADAESKMVIKMAVPFSVLGAGNSGVKAGDFISFSMIRIVTEAGDNSTVGTGWLEWGDFYNASKASTDGEGGDTGVSVTDPKSESNKTTTPNSFLLVKDDGTPATTDTPDTPATTGEKVTLKGTPSSWAKAEVEAALDADLIPEELTDGFTNGISRANLSKILSKLLDKVYGKDAEKSDAKFTDTTDADVLKAANLGIINGYEQADGTFMFKPNNTLKRSEMAAIINRVAKLCGQTVTGFDSEVTFTDTASHWCKGELGWPVHNGIVKGTSDTTFSPENTLTVEQTIMMIYRTYTALK